MYSSEELRTIAQKHRAYAESCHDQNIGAQYVKLAEVYESLAGSKDCLRVLVDKAPQLAPK
jgi:hypothetical protein